MATVMNPHHVHHVTSPRTTTQTICLAMGVLSLLVGVVGIFSSDFMGMHLSMTHNILNIGTGALALWAAYAQDHHRAYNTCMAFGALFGLVGVAGFIIGQPGYPSVGNLAPDTNLLRIIPNVLEYGTIEHLMNLIRGGIFLIGAMAYKSHYDRGTRGVVDVQRRADRTGTAGRSKDPANSETNLSRAPLGTSDVNRSSDTHRRTDFESRI
ncbi:MAG TPA: hypothetical protein VNJ01_17735 [Bacteriovoracaceae bacterium]|nr:hypothetical protein [Bacteriovoracaceae bacterium]